MKDAEMVSAFAACREMESSVMFPTDGAGVKIARAICDDCAVRAMCLEIALANREDHGMWGGKSERERRRILRARRARADRFSRMPAPVPAPKAASSESSVRVQVQAHQPPLGNIKHYDPTQRLGSY